jgi:hypothetical protein
VGRGGSTTHLGFNLRSEKRWKRRRRARSVEQGGSGGLARGDTRHVEETGKVGAQSLGLRAWDPLLEVRARRGPDAEAGWASCGGTCGVARRRAL